MGRRPQTKPTPEQEIMIKLRDERGMTFEDIGSLFDLSRQRVHQIYKRWKPEAEQPSEPPVAS